MPFMAGRSERPLPCLSSGIHLQVSQKALASPPGGAAGGEELIVKTTDELIKGGTLCVKGFIPPEVFQAGIHITNAAAANAVPVAEFTLAAILFANRNVFVLRDLYREKRHLLRAEQFTGSQVGNWRKTVGIVGLSRLGRRLRELLRPFDLQVIVHDP